MKQGALSSIILFFFFQAFQDHLKTLHDWGTVCIFLSIAAIIALHFMFFSVVKTIKYIYYNRFFFLPGSA